MNGSPEFYVPNSEMTSVASLVQFYLKSKTSVLLLGEKGSGKSVVFSKVSHEFSDKDYDFKYINLTRHLHDVDYEVSLLQTAIGNTHKNDVNVIVVVENFDLSSSVHAHFINSLLNGRSVLDRERTSQFVQLPKFVLFVEAFIEGGGTEGAKEEQTLHVPEMLSEQARTTLYCYKSKRRQNPLG